MRYVVTSIFLLLLPFLMKGQMISEQKAAQVACHFFSERVPASMDINSIRVIETSPDRLDAVSYFICNMSPAGFVIVSASERVLPVVAYSFEGSYLTGDAEQPGLKVWMNQYRSQILEAESKKIEPDAAITEQWVRYSASDFQPAQNRSAMQSVEPLLTTKWNQDFPYNNLSPLDPAGPGGHCFAGCVAAAMGQLENYYRFPSRGQGSYAYVHPVYGNFSANFEETTYDFGSMLSSITKENDSLSHLLLDQGISVDMDWGPTGSGMWNHKAAYSLKTYFRYGPETQYYFRDSVSLDWDSLLITNLDQRKPMYYAGWAGYNTQDGHAFVCDGYQPGNYYHFNWGWGGSYDGYFYTDALNPGGSNFNIAQEVIPLFPDTIQNTYPAGCQGYSLLGQLRGSVEDGSGWFNYENNTSCSWLISPQNAVYDSVKYIKLTFLRFDTEAGADSLYIYDGADETAPLLGAYTGSTLPTALSSTGNTVFLRFKTNGSNTRGGWLLDFEGILPIFCSGITTLTSPQGQIEDGSADKNYLPGSVCRWKITPAGGMPVVFYFTEFATADSMDVVKIMDMQTQELLGTFSGNALPPSVTAQSGKMLILFTTGSTNNGPGWKGEYYVSQLSVPELEGCDEPALLYPNPSTGILNIDLNMPLGREMQVTLTDLNGKHVFSQSFSGAEGKNHFTLDIRSLTPGIYNATIEKNGQKESHRFTLVK
jgi:hypothetical protein